MTRPRHRSYTPGMTAPVLFFDSGLGGLTVLRELRVLAPAQRLVYVADDAAFPYGAWEEAALQAHMLPLFDRLIARHRPRGVVVACNTASTVAIHALRERHPDVPFVGTVPAIKPAAERTSSGVVAVLATPGTVRRAYTRELIDTFARQAHVRLVGSERLAGMAERHLRRETLDDDDVRREIADCFYVNASGRTDIVVLACTHYPFLANVFRRLAPWPVDWLDPGEAIARRVLDVLPVALEEGHPDEPDVAEFTSGGVDASARRLLEGFGLRVVDA